MPELYDVLPRQHIPTLPLLDRMPSADPAAEAAALSGEVVTR